MRSIINAKRLFILRNIFSKYLNYPLLVVLWGVIVTSIFIFVDFWFAILILIIVFLNIGGFVSGLVLRQKQYWKKEQIYYLWDGFISNLFDIGILLLTYFYILNPKEPVFIFLAVSTLFINQLTRVSREAHAPDKLEIFLMETAIFIGLLFAIFLGLFIFFIIKTNAF